MMDRWQSLVDEQIRKLIGDGEVSHLPGAGRPLNLRADEMVPDEMRMAYKIMQDHDVLPGWIVQSRALDEMVETIRTRLARAADHYRRDRDYAARTRDAAAGRYAEQAWKQAQRAAREKIEEYNREVLSFNLRVPQGIPHKHPLSADQEIARAQQG